MLEWLIANVGTLFMGAVLLAVIILISVKLMGDKKRGKTSCGCNCAHCAMAGSCHKASGSEKTGETVKVSTVTK